MQIFHRLDNISYVSILLFYSNLVSMVYLCGYRFLLLCAKLLSHADGSLVTISIWE